MTAGNNGTNPPEGEDPFGYLYRSEDGASSGQGQQAGVPRRSYNEVRAVGDRRYGQQRSQPDQSPSPYYAAPETQPGGDPSSPPPSRRARGGGSQGPPRRNGLLIGALAVVGAVIIGVGAAIAFSDDETDTDAKPGPGPSQSAEPTEEETPEEQRPEENDKPLPQENASSLRLENGLEVQKVVEGSRAKDGSYIGGFKEGSQAIWAPTVPEAGKYTVYVGYSVPGKDADATLVVNGKPEGRPLNLSNFANAKAGEWDKGWTQTYALVNLEKGQNQIAVSCQKDNECTAMMDRIWLVEGHVN